MILRTVIVDDEQIVRQQLRRILSAETEVQVVDECADGLEALTAIEQHEPDLLLLDIGLPRMDGFAVMQSLGGRRLPLIVLFTGFDHLALHAFEAGAIDYLLKPTSPERIRAMLHRAREVLASLLRGLPPEREGSPIRKRRFCIRSGPRTTFVTTDQIDWIEASGNYVILHVGKESHFLREAITRLGEEVPKKRFCPRQPIRHRPD